MVRLITGEVKTCKPPPSPESMDVDHDVIDKTSLACTPEQKKERLAGFSKGCQQCVRRESSADAMELMVNRPMKYVLPFTSYFIRL
jgi:hypothetical protein